MSNVATGRGTAKRLATLPAILELGGTAARPKVAERKREPRVEGTATAFAFTPWYRGRGLTGVSTGV